MAVDAMHILGYTGIRRPQAACVKRLVDLFRRVWVLTRRESRGCTDVLMMLELVFLMSLEWHASRIQGDDGV